MLKQEQAEKELAKVRARDWKEKRLKEVGKLPANLVRVGRFLFDHDPVTGKDLRDWEKRQQYQKTIPAEAAKLRPAERKRLFATLFPRLGDALEGAWQLCGRLPYETDFDRKGFRAPGDETVTAASRWRFLETVVQELAGYDPTPAWLAAWAPYLSDGSGADSVGLLLAAAIDQGGPVGDEVFETLLASINRTHAVGAMGRHVTRGLLVASKPEGWDAVEKLLLAAQRQEGLRQSILETVDEAHPQAFRRMLKLILDHDLLRFSSTVRAAMVWFGVADQENESGSRFKKAFAAVLKYLDDPDAARKAIATAKGDELYFALWSAGFEDAVKALPLVEPLLKDKDVHRRYLAVLFLDAVGLPAARGLLVRAMDDVDLRVALRACEAARFADREPDDSTLFEPLVRLVGRMPEKATELKKIGPDDDEITADARALADDLPDHLGQRGAEDLLPYLPRMSGNGRSAVAERLGDMKPLSAKGREALFSLLGDRDQWVRDRVLDGLKKVTLQPAEAAQVEALFTRKNAELRKEGLKLLGRQKGDGALASADRLLASKNANQRLAGLELLRQLVDAKKAVAACRERATAYRDDHGKLPAVERSQLDAILNEKREVPTLDNALGLLDPSQLTPRVAPRKVAVQIVTPAARAILAGLDKFIAEHAETMVSLERDRDLDDDDLPDLDEAETEERADPRQMPLAAISYEMQAPLWRDPQAKDLTRMPLRAELTAWWRDRPAKLRDADGLELARAAALVEMSDWLFDYLTGANEETPAIKKAIKAVLGGVAEPVELEYPIGQELLGWLVRLEEPAGMADFLLDATEASLAAVPDELLKKKVDPDDYGDDWRDWNLFEFWTDRLRDDRDNRDDRWTAEQKGRHFRLLHWLEQPTPTAQRRRMDWDTVAAGYEAGLANLADVADQLLGPRFEDDYSSADFEAIGDVTRRPEPDILARRPELRDLVERARRRVLEVELARGDLPTAATGPAQAISSVVGLDDLVRVLTALGPKNLGRASYSDSKAAVLNDLVRATYPGPDDTPEAFAARMSELVKAKTIVPDLPLQLAFANPRWVGHVAHYLGLPALAEAVWWFYAHMDFATPELPEALEASLEKEGQRPGEHVSAWDRLVAQRTTLTEEDRDEGAVDTDWFRRVFDAVGAKEWDALQAACKYADSGYKNAQKLADVLRGKAKRADLMREVKQRKLKNSVRLLGLLPLAAGDKRDADLHERWKVLAAYRKYARGLSPLSREDAVRTGEIGLANLARTAGFADPNRLIWAMEWEEIQDLAAGPVSVTVDDVTVSLALDDQADPVTTVTRGDKALKAIPPKVRKNKKVAALVDRRAGLKQQAARIRQSLEGMMIRGDTLRGDELPGLMRHPLVAKNLSRLVLVGEGIRGYPVAEGKALEDFDGKKEPVKKDEALRLAHPLDLLKVKDWHDWQAHCFRIERVQPFKQVFREVYVLTEAEKADRTFSRRYAGQQVNPNQAMALFGTRGWRTMDGAEKAFPADDLVAEVTFQYGVGTPLEVEGLTVDKVEFRRRGDWDAVPLASVPKAIFSEVMRDVDLVVSVAHVGGVDPEASASTVEMRAALATELAALLGLKNVKAKGHHLLIDGTLGKYSLHLGSGTVHKMPGGSLCIVAVPAQHRGRVFLPFADNDPRTAEVLAKLLLLARDDEILDPGILDQLRR